jgi:hypothetical protein
LIIPLRGRGKGQDKPTRRLKAFRCAAIETILFGACSQIASRTLPDVCLGLRHDKNAQIYSIVPTNIIDTHVSAIAATTNRTPINNANRTHQNRSVFGCSAAILIITAYQGHRFLAVRFTRIVPPLEPEYHTNDHGDLEADVSPAYEAA